VEQKIVRAAGGALWRKEPDGRFSVLLVHRPRYDDWSWPKGKVDPGETLEQTALREVEEETGISPWLGPALTEITYHDAAGRTKQVVYFEMKIRTATPRESDDEVDETRWVPLDEVETILTWPQDERVAMALREHLSHRLDDRE